MKQYLYFLVMLIFYSSCIPKNEENRPEENFHRTSDYPDSILKYNLQEKFDNAKWAMYALNVDDTVYIKKYRDRIYISPKCKRNILEFDLFLNRLEIKNDTVVMTFDFYSKDSIECSPKKFVYTNQIYFWGQSDSIQYLGNDCCKPDFNMPKPEDFFKNPENYPNYKISDYGDLELSGYIALNESLEKFKEHICNNEKILNPWLRRQAIKKGIIK